MCRQARLSAIWVKVVRPGLTPRRCEFYERIRFLRRCESRYDHRRPFSVSGIAWAYALTSRRLSTTPVSAATVFVGALTLVLFTDATILRPADLRTGGALPARLLSIGLGLTIGAGFAILSPPTDAAVGKSAISDPRVPSLICQTLNVESGLNDGLVLPVFVFFLAAIPGTS